MILGLPRLGRALGPRHQDAGRPLDALLRAASYGQIYPELRRGSRTRGPDRGRGRARTAPAARRVYSCTARRPRGARRVAARPTVTVELRDESLAAALLRRPLPREQALGCSRAPASGTSSTWRSCARSTRVPARTRTFVDLGLRWGIAFNEWGARWCAGAAGALAEREDDGLSEPTFRGVLIDGLPGFLREGSCRSARSTRARARRPWPRRGRRSPGPDLPLRAPGRARRPRRRDRARLRVVPGSSSSLASSTATSPSRCCSGGVTARVLVSIPLGRSLAGASRRRGPLALARRRSRQARLRPSSPQGRGRLRPQRAARHACTARRVESFRGASSPNARARRSLVDPPRDASAPLTAS